MRLVSVCISAADPAKKNKTSMRPECLVFEMPIEISLWTLF